LILCLTLRLILSPVLLTLGEARSGPGNREGKNQESENTNPRRAEGGLYGSQAADPGWSVEIRTCHVKPTEDGGQRLEKKYTPKDGPRIQELFPGAALPGAASGPPGVKN